MTIAGNGVKRELVDVGRWGARNGRAALRGDLVSQIEPANQTRECTAAMVEHDTQSRMPFQYAAVYKQSRREPSVIQVANKVAQHILGKHSTRRRFEGVNTAHH